MRRFPGNFRRPRSRAAKMAQKKNRTFCQGYNASEMPFLSGRFAWSLRQYVNRCVRQYFQKRKGSHTHKNRLFEVCFSGYLVYGWKFNSSKDGIRTVARVSAIIWALAYADADLQRRIRKGLRVLTADPILLQASAYIAAVTGMNVAFLVVICG